MINDLRLQSLAIGSLPHKDLYRAMRLVRENFSEIPFLPQMVGMNEFEDMLTCFAPDKCGVEALALEPFLQLVRETKPKYAKAQVAGPFTLAATLMYNSGKQTLQDKTLRDDIVKTLGGKALWLAEQIKAANPPCGHPLAGGTTPIIFIDEPLLTHIGMPGFIEVSQEIVTEMIREVSDLIKENGGISGVHCCGACDWSIPVSAGVDIISFDAYTCSISPETAAEFLARGGKIAWGVVPTLDREVLAQADLPQMIEVFQRGVKHLTAHGINEKIIIDNSLITPSCGTGGLSEELAEKVLRLTRELSEALKLRHTER
jgi:methionine synthase II (cobalamin-independent)